MNKIKYGLLVACMAILGSSLHAAKVLLINTSKNDVKVLVDSSSVDLESGENKKYENLKKIKIGDTIKIFKPGNYLVSILSDGKGNLGYEIGMVKRAIFNNISKKLSEIEKININMEKIDESREKLFGKIFEQYEKKIEGLKKDYEKTVIDPLSEVKKTLKKYLDKVDNYYSGDLLDSKKNFQDSIYSFYGLVDDITDFDELEVKVAQVIKTEVKLPKGKKKKFVRTQKKGMTPNLLKELQNAMKKLKGKKTGEILDKKFDRFKKTVTPEEREKALKDLTLSIRVVRKRYKPEVPKKKKRPKIPKKRKGL